MRVDFSLDLVRIARYGMRFSRMFWKIAVWTQSATDDPEFVSPSTGHQILHQRRVIFQGVCSRCIANMQKLLKVRVCCRVCVYGESLLTSGERGIQE